MKALFIDQATPPGGVLYVQDAEGGVWFYRLSRGNLCYHGPVIPGSGLIPALSGTAVELLWHHGADALPALPLLERWAVPWFTRFDHPDHPLGDGRVELEVRHRDGVSQYVARAQPRHYSPQGYVLWDDIVEEPIRLDLQQS